MNNLSSRFFTALLHITSETNRLVGLFLPRKEAPVKMTGAFVSYLKTDGYFRIAAKPTPLGPRCVPMTAVTLANKISLGMDCGLRDMA